MTSAERASEIVFRGRDGNECEEFIAAIEELAFTEGWSHDQGRMLLFARSRLRHKALRWFARLDPSKRNDWYLFVEALFDHYPLVEAPPEVGTGMPSQSETTGASTAILASDQGLVLQPNAHDGGQTTDIRAHRFVPPSGRAYDPSIPGRRLGILYVVTDDETTGTQYVSRGRSPTYHYSSGSSSRIQYYDKLDTTVDRQEALVICFIPSTEPHPIACLNATNTARELCLRYSPTNNEYELELMGGVAAIHEKGSIYGPKQVSNVWNVLSDGSLEASLAAFDPSSHDGGGEYSKREDFKTTQVHLKTSGTSVRFVKPGTPLWQDDPKRNTQLRQYEVRARLVFAPL